MKQETIDHRITPRTLLDQHCGFSRSHNSLISKVLRDTQYRVFEYSSLFKKNADGRIDIKEYLDLLNGVSLENI